MCGLFASTCDTPCIVFNHIREECVCVCDEVEIDFLIKCVSQAVYIYCMRSSKPTACPNKNPKGNGIRTGKFLR